eukprot:1137229-Pelagomonas_calceolata.AAC.1
MVQVNKMANPGQRAGEARCGCVHAASSDGWVWLSGMERAGEARCGCVHAVSSDRWVWLSGVKRQVRHDALVRIAASLYGWVWLSGVALMSAPLGPTSGTWLLALWHIHIRAAMIRHALITGYGAVLNPWDEKHRSCMVHRAQLCAEAEMALSIKLPDFDHLQTTNSFIVLQICVDTPGLEPGVSGSWSRSRGEP